MALADRIVVVIPTLNEAAHIEQCLKSLLWNGAAPEAALTSLECVVADGGSTDGTQEIVRRLSDAHPQIRLMDNPKRLQAAAVNLVARSAGEARDILIRCDAHADYPPRFLLEVAEGLARHGADSLVVPMDAVAIEDTASCFQKANAWVVDTPLGSGGSAHRGGQKSGFVDHGHHAAFRRSRFVSLGGYDESFSHNEDAEYDKRLIDAGGKVYLDATIRIGYYPRGSVRALWRQYFGYGKGRAQNLAKHATRPKLRQMIPVLHILLLVFSCALLPFGLLGWVWPLLGLAWPLFYLGLVAGVSFVMMCWKKSLCGLLSGVAMAVMHTGWGAGFLLGPHMGAQERSKRGAA